MAVTGQLYDWGFDPRFLFDGNQCLEVAAEAGELSPLEWPQVHHPDGLELPVLLSLCQRVEALWATQFYWGSCQELNTEDQKIAAERAAQYLIPVCEYFFFNLIGALYKKTVLAMSDDVRPYPSEFLKPIHATNRPQNPDLTGQPNKDLAGLVPYGFTEFGRKEGEKNDQLRDERQRRFINATRETAIALKQSVRDLRLAVRDWDPARGMEEVKEKLITFNTAWRGYTVLLPILPDDRDRISKNLDPSYYNTLYKNRDLPNQRRSSIHLGMDQNKAEYDQLDQLAASQLQVSAARDQYCLRLSGKLKDSPERIEETPVIDPPSRFDEFCKGVVVVFWYCVDVIISLISSFQKQWQKWTLP